MGKKTNEVCAGGRLRLFFFTRQERFEEKAALSAKFRLQRSYMRPYFSHSSSTRPAPLLRLRSVPPAAGGIYHFQARYKK